jgi:UPF0148 protein
LQDEKVSKMAEVLLAGGKMLSTHCPECKSPLFEYRGKIACPACGWEGQAKREPEKEGEKPRRETPAGDTEQVLLEKLDQLATKLKNETNPRAMSEILESMRLILVVLEKIKAR